MVCDRADTEALTHWLTPRAYRDTHVCLTIMLASKQSLASDLGLEIDFFLIVGHSPFGTIGLYVKGFGPKVAPIVGR